MLVIDKLDSRFVTVQFCYTGMIAGLISERIGLHLVLLQLLLVIGQLKGQLTRGAYVSAYACMRFSCKLLKSNKWYNVQFGVNNHLYILQRLQIARDRRASAI